MKTQKQMKTMIVLALLLWGISPRVTAQEKFTKGENVVLVVNNSNKRLTDIVPFEKRNAKNLIKQYPKSTFYAGKLYGVMKSNNSSLSKKGEFLPLKGARSFNLQKGTLITVNTQKAYIPGGQFIPGDQFLPGDQFIPGDQFLVMFNKKTRQAVLKIQ